MSGSCFNFATFYQKIVLLSVITAYSVIVESKKVLTFINIKIKYKNNIYILCRHFSYFIYNLSLRNIFTIKTASAKDNFSLQKQSHKICHSCF